MNPGGAAGSNDPDQLLDALDETDVELRSLYRQLADNPDLVGEHEGVVFHQPPHDEPWERAMTAFDPDGYAVEFAQGKRGKNQPKA
jgi:hypothetical protein